MNKSPRHVRGLSRILHLISAAGQNLCRLARSASASLSSGGYQLGAAISIMHSSPGAKTSRWGVWIFTSCSPTETRYSVRSVRKMKKKGTLSAMDQRLRPLGLNTSIPRYLP